jgi:hypothetical protein
MIITDLKQLPFKTYTAFLLKSEDDIKLEEKENPNKFIWISKHPKMIILFIEFVEEISGKITKEVQNAV